MGSSGRLGKTVNSFLYLLIYFSLTLSSVLYTCICYKYKLITNNKSDGVKSRVRDIYVSVGKGANTIV